MKSKQTTEATKRFLEAMHEIIKRDRMNRGDITTVAAFAESIGQFPQNISKFNNNEKQVTLQMLIDICMKYKVNPTFIVLGKGEMFLRDDASYLGDTLEKNIKSLERRVKELEKSL